MSEELPIKIRGVKDSDDRFILSTWKSTLKMDATCAWMPDKLFFQEYNDRCDKTMYAQVCQLAVSKEDPSFIIGWICHDEDILNYCFVREEYRKLGVYKTLAKHAFQGSKIIYTSFWTDGMEQFENSPYEYIYRPHLAKRFGYGKARRYKWSWSKGYDNKD